MSAPVDVLEAKRADTYAHLIGSEEDCLEFDEKVHWLENQLDQIYRSAIQESRKDIPVSEIFKLWGKMGDICDFFIQYVQAVAANSPCPADYRRLRQLRSDSYEKQEFYRC